MAGLKSTADELTDDNDMCSAEKANVPLALWSIVLGRVNDQQWTVSETASVMYTLLREGPALTANQPVECNDMLE